MSKQLNLDINTFNDYGSSLIFGHPQAPTAGRSIIEGIEEAVMPGGGKMKYHQRKRLRTIVLAAFGVLIWFSVSTAEDYFVSSTGNDSASGAVSAPWKTLQHAANLVSAGDTVTVASGTYAGFKSTSGGTPGSPIIFKADVGALVVINAVSPDSWHGSIIEIEDHDWWVIDGFEVTGAPTNAGIDVRVADHVTVRHC